MASASDAFPAVNFDFYPLHENDAILDIAPRFNCADSTDRSTLKSLASRTNSTAFFDGIRSARLSLNLARCSGKSYSMEAMEELKSVVSDCLRAGFGESGAMIRVGRVRPLSMDPRKSGSGVTVEGPGLGNSGGASSSTAAEPTQTEQATFDAELLAAMREEFGDVY